MEGLEDNMVGYMVEAMQELEEGRRILSININRSFFDWTFGSLRKKLERERDCM